MSVTSKQVHLGKGIKELMTNLYKVSIVSSENRNSFKI